MFCYFVYMLLFFLVCLSFVLILVLLLFRLGSCYRFCSFVIDIIVCFFSLRMISKERFCLALTRTMSRSSAKSFISFPSTLATLLPGSRTMSFMCKGGSPFRHIPGNSRVIIVFLAMFVLLNGSVEERLIRFLICR